MIAVNTATDPFSASATPREVRGIRRHFYIISHPRRSLGEVNSSPRYEVLSMEGIWVASLCSTLKSCSKMALLFSRKSEKQQCLPVSGNTGERYPQCSLGRHPFPRKLAKSLSIPQGSWHRGQSHGEAEAL